MTATLDAAAGVHRNEATAALNSGLEWVKWLALATMVIDHAGKIAFTDWFLATHLVGRLAFPLFAWIIAVRLSTRPDLLPGYLRWLLVFALLSQPAFVLAGKPWWEGNILVTLVLGAVAIAIYRARAGRPLGHTLAGLGLCVAAGITSDFAPLGVVCVVVLYAAAERSLMLSALVAGPVGLFANVDFVEPVSALLGATALLATPVACLALTRTVRLPRSPKLLFYGFYPAHLVALHLLDLWLRRP